LHNRNVRIFVVANMMRSIRNPLRRVAQRYYATQLSFATPYADACGPNEFEVKASIAAAKAAPKMDSRFVRDSLSFATPMSDVCGPSQAELRALDAAAAAAPQFDASHINFATAYSDAVGGYSVSELEALDAEAAAAPEPSMSFATAYSDAVGGYSAAELDALDAAAAAAPECSLSWSTPLADAMAHRPAELAALDAAAAASRYETAVSFATPYSDCVGPTASELAALDAAAALPQDAYDASHLSFSQALSDAAGLTAREHERLAAERAARPLYATTLSYGTPLADFAARGATLEVKTFADLPTTFDEAVAEGAPGAIVVTEARRPFRICHVNREWVDLCGFSQDEARDASLNLIQGPATDLVALDDMVEHLLRGRSAEVTVTNYRKDASAFANKLKAAPLRSPTTGEITHFVGVLSDVSERPITASAV
jgi:PAS domain S-box-containing protein